MKAFLMYRDRDFDWNQPLPPNAEATPVFRNIHIRNVTCRDASQAMVLTGLPESPVQDVTLEDVTIKARKGAQEEQTKGIQKIRVKVETH